MNTIQLINTLSAQLTNVGIDNAKRVVEELLSALLHCKPLEIYLPQNPVTPTILQALETQIERIKQGEPLQYIVGHVDFWGLQLKCDPRALIPRAETELLVEEVLSSKIWDQKPATLIDVGTGSGCIVITLATQRPDASFKAIDLSTEALELAQENAALHGVKERILWLNKSLLDDCAPQSCNAVIANLPYIPTQQWEKLAPSVHDYEPRAALDGGILGMDFIQELATQARYVLAPEGMLFLEFGYDQGDVVASCLKNIGYQNIQIKKDLAGHDRMAIAENPDGQPNRFY